MKKLLKNLLLSGASLVVGLASHPARADQIKYLAHGESALAARLLEIRGARQSVDVATYDLDACDTGIKLLVNELIARANAGVHVRVLVDARNQKREERLNLQAIFTRNKIEFKLYNDGFLMAENLRTHVKLQVVDGRSYIIGGRNLKGAYFGLGKKMNWLDREALVEGTSAPQAQAYFNELWGSPKTLKPRAATADISAWERSCLGQTEVDKRLAADLEINGLKYVRQIPTRVCGDVSVHGDNPEFLNNYYLDQAPPNIQIGTPTDIYGSDILAQGSRFAQKRNSLMHVNFIYGTQKSLLIENWAYMPELRLSGEIRHLREKGLPILAISNLPEGAWKDQDNPFTAMLDRYERRDDVGSQRVLPVCDRGAMNDNSAFTPPGLRWVIHSKVAVRDSKDVIIGSYNFDERSYDTNLEASMLVNNCPALAADVQAEAAKLVQAFNQDIDQNTCPRSGSAPLLHRVAGWIARPFF